jgi:hypothetical protein
VGAVVIVLHSAGGSARSGLAESALGLEDTGFRVEGARRDRLNKALEDLRLVRK